MDFDVIDRHDQPAAVVHLYGYDLTMLRDVVAGMLECSHDFGRHRGGGILQHACVERLSLDGGHLEILGLAARILCGGERDHLPMRTGDGGNWRAHARRTDTHTVTRLVRLGRDRPDGVSAVLPMPFFSRPRRKPPLLFGACRRVLSFASLSPYGGEEDIALHAV